jgi:hypothetical protein
MFSCADKRSDRTNRAVDGPAFPVFHRKISDQNENNHCNRALTLTLSNCMESSFASDGPLRAAMRIDPQIIPCYPKSSLPVVLLFEPRAETVRRSFGLRGTARARRARQRRMLWAMCAGVFARAFASA